MHERVKDQAEAIEEIIDNFAAVHGEEKKELLGLVHNVATLCMIALDLGRDMPEGFVEMLQSLHSNSIGAAFNLAKVDKKCRDEILRTSLILFQKTNQMSENFNG